MDEVGIHAPATTSKDFLSIFVEGNCKRRERGGRKRLEREQGRAKRRKSKEEEEMY